MEDGRVFDEGLRNRVARAIGGAVVLVLRIRRVIIRQRRRVALLRALATGLALVS